MTLSLPFQIRRYVCSLLLAWTVVCIGAFAFVVFDARDHVRRFALESAQESLQKDLVYRIWGAGHGGVYVPVTAATPPNPYLAHVPHRDVLTTDGTRLTLVNPAYMTRQVHELAREKFGSIGHITSLKPVRPENAADAWESLALQRFEQGAAAVDEVVEIDGVPHLRAMIPLKTEPACLKCHAAQGYKVGEIRGGLSVALSLQDYLATADAQKRRHGWTLMGLWGGGIAIVIFGGQLLTQRIRREEEARDELSQSEHRYRQLFDNMDGAFALGEIIYDAAGNAVDYRLLVVNAAFETMSGRSADTLVGQPASELEVPEEWNWLERYAMTAQSRTSDSFFLFSQRLKKYLGTRTFSPQPGQFAVLTSDITERMTAEIKVKESRQRFQTLVDSTEGIVWELDLKTFCFTFVSQHAVALLGYPLDAWAEPNFWVDHLHPDDRFWTLHNCLEQTRLQRNHAMEYRMLASDGRFIWIRDLVSVHVVDGELQMLSGVMIDVTEARRASQRLEEYRLAVESAEEMICVIDCDYRYLLANRAFLAMRATESAAVVGRTVREVLGEPTFAVIEPRLIECFAGANYSYEMEHEYGSGGRRRLLVTYSPVWEKEEVTRVVAVIRDITATKAAELALIESSRVAKAANQAKTEFLANMSHELRTPLNGVLGMLQLLKTTELSPEQQDYIATATSTGWNLLELLNDLLDLTRIEAGKMVLRLEPFALAQTVRQVNELFAVTLADKHLTMTCHLDPALPDVLTGDESRLRQILFNLLGNAVKFTPERGRIELRVKRGSSADPQIIPVNFTVEDNGIGMTPDVLDKVFSPFIQGDNVYNKRYQGAGLGLAIVTRLIETMDGMIQIESQPGKGTTLMVSLPLRAVLDSADSLAQQGPASPRLPGDPRRILLVEDNAINRLAMERLLGHNRAYEVETAEDGLAALKQLAAADFDLVLMDIQMPVMDGLEALRHIRSGAHGVRNPAIPVVAMTAYAMQSDREKFLQAGMNDYLSKPVEWLALEGCLQRVMAQS